MNLLETLHIQTISAEPTSVICRLKVSDEHLQPFGLLHGGLHTVLAETAASIGANLQLTDQVAVGASIHTEHLKPVHKGVDVDYRATPEHIGRSSQVWRIVATSQQQTVAVATCRLFIVPKP